MEYILISQPLHQSMHIVVSYYKLVTRINKVFKVPNINKALNLRHENKSKGNSISETPTMSSKINLASMHQSQSFV
jgi:hypothetical protein